MKIENKITKITRRDILLSLLDIESSVVKFFELDERLEGAYQSVAAGYMQHRIRNSDWEDDWFIDDSTLGILELPDDVFLKLCTAFVHPETTHDLGIIRSRLHIINSKLVRDGFEIFKSGKISGYDVYSGRELVFAEKSRKKIKFYVPRYADVNNLNESDYPLLFLYHDNWDDFNYKTTFDLYFYKDIYSPRIEIGAVKIARNDDKITELPPSFNFLDDSYYSLMNSKDTYSMLKSNPDVAPYALNILESLNDLTVKTSLLERVQNYSAFNNSLLRNFEVRNLLAFTKTYSFSFSNDYEGIITPIDFNFNENPVLPFRTIAIIGENGSGKTTLLRRITKGLVQFSENKEKFSIRPNFSRVITISYSLFDSAQPPECTEDDINYIYCGLWQSDAERDILETLKSRFLKSLLEIENREQKNIWMYIIKDFLSENIDLSSSDNADIERNYKSLSSGQKILVTIFTEILAKIEQGSLILFDEPETHLHPSMIFKLIKTLNKILEDYSSYLIIATHSPIVIQQIPAKSVMVLKDGYVSPLSVESFGENFSTITKEVFRNYESTDVAYKELFKDLVERKFSEEQILNAFDNKLNLNAKIYLNSLFN